MANTNHNKSFLKVNRNPRNSENTLYRKLTKLFSGPIVDYERQTPRTLRKRDLNKYKKRFKSAAGIPFKRDEFNPYEKLGSSYFAAQNRAERYSDFDQMEFNPMLATALDIYADEITSSSDLRKLLTIKCPNQEVKTIIETLFHNILNVEYNLFGWVRNLCKYGDFFLYLEIDQEKGITHALGLPPAEIERLEGEDDDNPNYIQFQWNTTGFTLETWQVAHFRNLGNDKFAPYGTSVLDSARRTWRQYDLMLQAVMAYRIVRAPERRVYYVDVGHIDPDDVEQYILDMSRRLKKNLIVDDQTGRVDQRYNPMSLEEDIYLPQRGKDRGTRVETLSGGQWTGDVDDLKLLRDEMLMAIKIPFEYLMGGTEGKGEQTSLAQKDIRFARTILRLQKNIISELIKVAQIHLFTLGYRGDDLTSFKLTLNNPSQLSELQELESLRTKFEVAAAANEGFFSKRYVYEKIFGMTKEEIRRTQLEIYTDRKMDALYEMAYENTTAEERGDLGMGDLEGLDGLDGLGLSPEDQAMADLQGTAGDVGATGPEGGSLMAAPGRRDWTTTPASKGKWYKPVATDSRVSGARNRHMKAISGGSITSNTERNVMRGMQGLRRLGRGITKENLDEHFDELIEYQLGLTANNLNESSMQVVEEDTYNEEEKLLFENIDSIEELGKVINKISVKRSKKRRYEDKA